MYSPNDYIVKLSPAPSELVVSVVVVPDESVVVVVVVSEPLTSNCLFKKSI